MAERRWTQSLGSVRTRTTTAAVLVGGLALFAAALLLISLLERGLERNVRDAAILQAQFLASSLEFGTDPSDLVIPDQVDLAIQVVDEEGTVLRASPSVRERDPVIAGAASAGELEGRFTLDREPYLAVGTQADTPNGLVTVLVGRSLEPIQESTDVARDLLALAVPVLLVVVAITTWMIVGRALAPVEAIRREVAEISATELYRRVPTPSSSDEVSRLARTMNDMLTRLDASRRRQEQLVSDASHELRNPIAAIRQYAEVALAHPEQISARELAEDVLTEDVRLQHLVEDLLLLARADENMLDLNAAPVDLDDIVLDEAARLRKTTQLDVDTQAVSATRLVGDRAALQRIVRNLADNAARHAQSTVRFEVTGSGDEALILVDDDGTGVALEDRDSVFERFTRLDDARDRDHGGAGLGLAIVTEIVAAHGGSAAVDEAPLGGARFRIALPRSSH